MNTIPFVDRNALITAHIPLAEKIAKSKKKKLSNVAYDELKSAAYMGLVEAAHKYVPAENDCFAAFAVFRIIGAVKDYLRELSWGSRANPVKTSEVFEDEVSEKPACCSGEFFDEVVKQLPSTHRTILRLYYLDNRGIKEIATDMGVHQSRISQLLSDSRTRLRAAWQDRQCELWADVA